MIFAPEPYGFLWILMEHNIMVKHPKECGFPLCCVGWISSFSDQHDKGQTYQPAMLKPYSFNIAEGKGKGKEMKGKGKEMKGKGKGWQ